MSKTVAFRKKGYETGTVRDYGKYGLYKKQSDGSWKRLKKGYPTFRRTLSFARIKAFLMEKGYGDAFVERHSAPQLRALMKSEGLTRQFNRWVEQHKEDDNG